MTLVSRGIDKYQFFKELTLWFLLLLIDDEVIRSALCSIQFAEVFR